MNYSIVVPWHRQEQIDKFLEEWCVRVIPDWLILQQDVTKEGCAVTKNKGIARALQTDAEFICVLDDDCFPNDEVDSLVKFARMHEMALRPRPYPLMQHITYPHSRGTPYFTKKVELPVAASIGCWAEYPDYDAVTALAFGPKCPGGTKFNQELMYQRYFPFCGMNFAFRRGWSDCAQLIDVARFDDIFMGWVFEKVAYANGFCFNLQGPTVRHSRQSNLWQNLKDEAKYLEFNETVWQRIHQDVSVDPQLLRDRYLSPATLLSFEGASDAQERDSAVQNSIPASLTAFLAMAPEDPTGRWVLRDSL